MTLSVSVGGTTHTSPSRRRSLAQALCALSLLFGAGQANAQTTEKPGKDVRVISARADWATGYFEAEVVAALLRKLGYDVSPPGQRELSPDVFYPAVASRLVDYSANGWFPVQDVKLKMALPMRGIVGDLATPIGTLVPDGALLGYMVDKPTADELGIVSMNDFTRPEVAAAFDRDGDGMADMLGCNQGWACAGYIDEQIARRGWLVEQEQGDYDDLFEDVVERVRKGEPALYVTWTPGYMIADLVPGREVTWLQAPGPDGVNTSVAGIEGCTGDPCETGFVPNSIRIVANKEFLAKNPAAARLFEVVEIDPRDISLQNLWMENGENTARDVQRHAAEWIEANADKVDGWLAEARAAATGN